MQKRLLEILFFAIPAAAGLFFRAEKIVAALFLHGNFAAESAEIVALILKFLALSIPFESAVHLFSRAFLSRGNSKIPCAGQILFFAVATIGAVFAGKFAAVEILPISFAAGAAAQFLFLGKFLSREIKFDFKKLARDFLPIAIATAGMILFLNFVGFGAGILNLILEVGAGAGVFFAGIFIAKKIANFFYFS